MLSTMLRGDALERGDLGALGKRDLWRGGTSGRWRARRRGLWRRAVGAGACGVGAAGALLGLRGGAAGGGTVARGLVARCGVGRDDLAVAASDDHRAGVEVGEELAPALAHGVRVAEVLRVEVFDVAAVVSEGVHWRERVRAGGAESASGEGNAGVFAPIPEDSPYTPAARPPEATARR